MTAPASAQNRSVRRLALELQCRLTMSNLLAADDLADLLAEHRPAMLGRARRLCRDDVEAEDLVQDALERAVRAAPSLRDGARGRAWLFTILRNAFVDNLRRRRAAQVLELLDDDAHAVPETPPPALSQRFDDGDLWSAVELLPDELRAAFCLHVRDGADYVAIAARLGIAKSTVGTRLFRARRALRELMVA